MKKYILLILIAISGCKWGTGYKAAPFAMLGMPEPDGTPIFKEGFKDGCGSILRNRGTGLFRDRYEYNYNIKLMENPEYQFGFSRGWTNCFNHVVAGRHTLGGSADTYIYGGNWGAPIDMGRADWTGTINYETGSWNDVFASGGGVTGTTFSPIQTGKGGSGTAFGSHPLWGTPNDKQIFGW